jgi:hypothetical protein
VSNALSHFGAGHHGTQHFWSLHVGWHTGQQHFLDRRVLHHDLHHAAKLVGYILIAATAAAACCAAASCIG